MAGARSDPWMSELDRPQDKPSEGTAVWVAMGAAITGVLIGGAAVYLGLQRPELTTAAAAATLAPLSPPPEVEAALATEPAVAAPTTEERLVAAIAKTRDAVVNLETPRGLGAGVIVDERGIVLTNYHVVDAALRPPSVGLFSAPEDLATPTLMARFENDRRVPTELLVLDPEEDLAVLRLVPEDKNERFVAADLGRSAEVQVGQEVFAIGNPHGLPHSVSRGIVSAKDRTDILSKRELGVLQLDASINMGNSGGPLFDLDGNLIGIVTARQREAEGIAFALPSDHVRGFLGAIGEGQALRSGMIGVNLDPNWKLADNVRDLGYAAGLSVAKVQDDNPAEAAGLRPGDVIVAIRGKRLDGLGRATDPEALATHLQATVRSMYPGEILPLTVVRGDERVILEVEIKSASDRDQTFIDAEDLLGVVLDRTSDVPKIQELRSTSPLARYGDALRGTQIVRLMGERVETTESIGERLAELRQLVRKQGATPLVLVGVRDAAGREADIPISVR